LKHYKKEVNIFDEFFEHRDSLIVQYKNGDITKKEYIEENHKYILGMKIKPFRRIDSYEKGMYNYQYYNMMAKYYNLLAKEEKNNSKHFSYYKKYLEDCNYFYNEKDKTTFRLKNILYEIVLEDYEYAVLHSKSIWILNVLKKEGVFLEKERKSVIDYYVNEEY
jgi:hypothetical protein